jgi:SAM-dependent methyltransferase
VSDARTVALYDAEAAAYAARFDTAPRPALAAFVGVVPAGGRVLDLGCGPGRSAAAMIAAGLRVDAWDAAPGMVTEARRIGVEAQQAEFADLSAVDAYDGVWANFSLLHAPRREMPGLLRAIATALVTGGYLHLGLKVGTGEGRDALGRFYTYYGEDEIAALLRGAGLAIVSRRVGRDTGFDGTEAAWITLLARA